MHPSLYHDDEFSFSLYPIILPFPSALPLIQFAYLIFIHSFPYYLLSLLYFSTLPPIFFLFPPLPITTYIYLAPSPFSSFLITHPKSPIFLYLIRFAFFFCLNLLLLSFSSPSFFYITFSFVYYPPIPHSSLPSFIPQKFLLLFWSLFLSLSYTPFPFL